MPEKVNWSVSIPITKYRLVVLLKGQLLKIKLPLEHNLAIIQCVNLIFYILFCKLLCFYTHY